MFFHSAGCLLILLIVSFDVQKLFSLICCAVLSCSVMADSLPPHGLWPARLLCPWGFSRQEYWSGLPCPPPGALPNPGIEPRSSTLQADFLPSEPPGKPMSTGVGSLSLLQGNLPDPGINLRSSTLQVDTLPAKLPGKCYRGK